MIKLRTFAKLNLSLALFKPRLDGYHPLQSVFQTISLHDTLTLTKQPKHHWHLSCNNPKVPTDETNLLSKVFRSFEPQLEFGLEIHLEKTIPLGGGCGGGSSNAAALMHFLNTEADWNYSLEKLEELSLPFGADIPFFIRGGTAYVEGIGEKLSPLPALKDIYFVLINPGFSMHTQTMYKAWDKENPKAKNPSNTVISLAAPYLGNNDFLNVGCTVYPELKTALDQLSTIDDTPVHLSGSGSTLFTVFNTIKEAQQWKAKAEAKHPQWTFYLAEPTPQGHLYV